MDDDVREAAIKFGRIGGKATSDKYGPDHYRKMQALGVKTKLKKKNENKMKYNQVKDGQWVQTAKYSGCCDCGLIHRVESKVFAQGKSVNDFIKKHGGKLKIMQRF